MATCGEGTTDGGVHIAAGSGNHMKTEFGSESENLRELDEQGCQRWSKVASL